MKIIDLLNKIVNGEETPRMVRYKMYMEGYDIFKWNEEEREYLNSADEPLRVPAHHLTDELEIIENLSLGDIINNIGRVLEELNEEWEKLKDEIHKFKRS